MKSDPLPPLRPMPSAPTQVFAHRVGDLVTLRLNVPAENVDPATSVSISGVEIYAQTVPFGSPEPILDQLLRQENLVGTIDVRPAPLVSDDAPAPPPVPEGPPDPRPVPGDLVVWSETIPAGARALDLTREQRARVEGARPIWIPIRPAGLLVPVIRVQLPTRYYVAVGVSDRHRVGRPSPILAIPFGPAPESPSALTPGFTETALTLAWTTSEPSAPVTVVETTPTGQEQPTPVQVAPITTGKWQTPVSFGVERCFVVRQVIRRGAVSIESATVGPACVTPVDTFGPPAPTGLVAVSAPDGISLLWDAVTASDLAGYLVLREDGPNVAAEAITPKPVTSLQWQDSTARLGVRYVYFIVAVDASGNQGERSDGFAIERLTSQEHQ